MIEKNLHFVYLKDELKSETAYDFNVINFVCVMSALSKNPDYKAYFWTNLSPEQRAKMPFLEKLKSKVTFGQILAPKEIFGNPITFVQHQADIVKIDKLIEYGGVFMDTDVLVVKPFDDLLDNTFVLGKENKTRIGMAIVMAEKGSQIVQEWREGYRDFNGNQYKGHAHYKSLKTREEKKAQQFFWIYNSIYKLGDILQKHPEAKILEKQAFYYPSNHFSEWNDFAGKPKEAIPGIEQSYGHHLWLSTRPELTKLTMDKIMAKQGYFYAEAQNYIKPYVWGK